MLSIRDQENLATTHQTTAANKPLNQNIRALQPRTPGPHKTPFRPQNDENTNLQTGKAAQNTFITPAPKTTARAPLGAKTTNVKANAFQTPAPGQKRAKPVDQTVKKPQSSARRSIKKKIHVQPECVPAPQELAESEEEEEPDSIANPSFLRPPPADLPDPSIDFSEIEPLYEYLRPENCSLGIGQVYFQSPKDENGFSISGKKKDQQYKQTLQDDLDKILQQPVETSKDPDEQLREIIRAGPKSQTQASKPSTLKARTAADALSKPLAMRTHQNIPNAATRETAATKNKRKPTFTVAHDNTLTSATQRSMPPPVSRITIGFPKARKPASIVPHNERSASKHETSKQEDIDITKISPRKFVDLYGEPPVESEMWFRLMNLQIQDRHRNDNGEQESIFNFDDHEEASEDLDRKLGIGMEEEGFELTLDDL